MWLLTFAILFKEEKDSSDIFLIVFSVAYPLILFVQYWRFAYSKENAIIYKERQHEIFANKIVSQMGEISESTIPLESFIKTLELKNLYILYISKGQTLMLPKRIFETPQDENWFKDEVFLKI